MPQHRAPHRDSEDPAQPTWSAVDAYIVSQLLPADPILDQVQEANAAADLPAIDVSPNQGRLLHLLARMHGARRILEVGTLGGYSTIWLARALPPDGSLITLEVEPRHAEVARRNFEIAGLAARIQVQVGPAAASLNRLIEADTTPFDLVFIDADKPNNPVYLDLAMQLTRPGSLIVVDNVVREGSLVHADSSDPAVRGTRALFERVHANPRLEATALQTVGDKGYDGFLLARVIS